MQQINCDEQRKPLRTVVIPIAGFGTRMFPASKSIPKALLPMIDKDGLCKPVLHVVIEEALTALPFYDVRIVVVLSPSQKPLVESYFYVPEEDADDAQFAAYMKHAQCKLQLERIRFIAKRLSFVCQLEQKGFGHAILCAREAVGNEPFLVMLGDHVYSSSHPQGISCVAQLVAAFEAAAVKFTGQFASATALCTTGEQELHLNGIVKGSFLEREEKLGITCLACESTMEKPSVAEAKQLHFNLSPSDCSALSLSPMTDNEGEVSSGGADRYLCYFGIDLMSPKIFDILEDNLNIGRLTKGELQLRDGQFELMKPEFGRMVGVLIQGARHDTGIPPAYVDSMHQMYQQHLSLANNC